MSASQECVVYADGVLELHNLGSNFAMTFFVYETDPMGGPDIKVPVLKLIRPKSSIASPDCPLVEKLAKMPDPTAPERVRMHA